MTDTHRHFSVSPMTLAMLFADARLPVGGHVSSAGLEPALAAGMACA
jgi:urease accessory protein